MSRQQSIGPSSGRVEVVCHRGASNRAPDNTLAAARQAVAQGGDYVELDVNLSADGVHYVFHGPKLEGTTNGVGLLHEQRAATLDSLDAGSWFGPDFVGEPIPRLETMLEELRGKTKVFFDVKRADLPALLAMVERTGFADDCFFWFGRDADARAFRELNRDLPLKINIRTADDVRRAHADYGAALVEVPPRHLSRGVVEVCRELGVKLIINYMGAEPAVFSELARWPIDMINLDHMNLWQAAVAERAEADAARKDGAISSSHADIAIPVAGPPVRRVVLFLLDGCRPDALQQADTPAIDSLAARGAHTWQARTVMPSISLPCHTALFYSLDPQAHGVVENVWQRPPSPAQSLAEVIAAARHEVAMFYTWEELRDLSVPGTVKLASQHRLSQEGLAEVGKAAAAKIAEFKPTFSFVYLEATDALGHSYGWMSPEYLEAVSYSDGLVQAVMDALAAGGDDDETIYVVMADHGGHAFGHGTDAPEDMTIPFIVAGPGIRQNYDIGGPVSIVDVAPTLLHLLGLEIPDHWQGQVIAEALMDRADTAG
ncbi:MAG: alkaline phosphatase family protein [Litorilinea sp.]